MTETMNEATYKLHSPQLLHSLPFQQQNKSVYIRSNTEEREENKQRWRGMILHSTNNQNTLQLMFFHFKHRF